ncbi:MAG TPA: hypothetical protein VIQ54_32125, partial [Polyangia bacterium]
TGVAGTTGVAGIIGTTGTAGTGGAGVCTPTAMRCLANTPQSCSAQGQWVSGQPCPFVCTGAGVCGGQCVPNTMRCQGGQNQICDSTGFWQNTGASTIQLLRNPNFDTSPIYWTQVSGLGVGYSIIASPPSGLLAHTAPFIAWEGGYEDAADDLYQTLTIPAGATSITYSFYYYVATQETAPVVYDAMDAYIYDSVTQQASVLVELSNVTATTAWTLFSVQLPLNLAGRPLDFGFAAITDYDFNTNFFVDTVSLTAAACPAATGAF